jgi:hypothetical protein
MIERYDDIIEEMMQLIPQYCPEWTNLGPADPGVTLVQLFAWMTEMVLYRVNRVPDKTYIHFLNFIGEDRNVARPSVAPVTFSTRLDEAVEVPAYTTCATRQTENRVALNFLTVEPLTVHSAQIRRLVSVRGGQHPLVRDIPFTNIKGNSSAICLDKGNGIQIFEMDPVEYGADSYTPNQFLYIAHDDFKLMNIEKMRDRPLGSIKIKMGEEEISVIDFFEWQYPTQEGWMPVTVYQEEDDMIANPEKVLLASLPGIVEDTFDIGGVNNQLPEGVKDKKYWIRGLLDYESWLVQQMHEDLRVFWRDDRGAEPRPVNVSIRARGRSIEFELYDLPPIKAGWLLVFEMVNRSMAAGRNEYFPLYRWYYRRGDDWEEIPSNQVRIQQTSICIEGPMIDMASEGVNLRAERIETVDVSRLCRDLELDIQWIRPIEKTLLFGENTKYLSELELDAAPWDPFQINATIAPTIGRQLYIGSDLLINRRQEMVSVEVTYSFEMNGETIEEPIDSYALQLSYRADDSWRLVYTEDKIYTKFRFNDLQDGQPVRAGEQTIVFRLDPKKHIKDITAHPVQGQSSGWLRLELIKANLMGKDDEENDHPIRLRICKIELGMGASVDVQSYQEPLRSARMLQLDYRNYNERLTRIVSRLAGRSYTYYPFYPFIEIDDENQSFYIELDRELPVGNRHAISFRCRGEAFLPEEIGVEWEMLEEMGKNRVGWFQLKAEEESEDGRIRPPYALNRTGNLEFPLQKSVKISEHGVWLRARFKTDQETRVENIPNLPPVSHIMLNTVNAVNLNTMRTERYSGQGIPNQEIQLLKKSLYLHEQSSSRPIFNQPEKFPDIKVFVDNEDGQREEWRGISDAEMLVAGKDDLVFTVDAVEGVLTFGNGIRGKMLPFGSNNILIDIYRVVVGNNGNVAPYDIEVCDGISVIDVVNLLPGNGGRDAETIEEIIQRAPSLLTTRDRAVTASDFELIAKESSSEVARAACDGRMDGDGKVSIVILPHRRKGEVIPNTFLSEGLRDHVSGYLQSRCLINVQPIVRLAKFMMIDISISLRLRPKSNIIQVREAAQSWVANFLDPYTGGLDEEGWPFAGTLYAQDFARMVSEITEVRHVTHVQLFDMSTKDIRSVSGWETGSGEQELTLRAFDLFYARRIRVQMGD